MKRIVPLLLSAAMLVSLATSCTNTGDTPSTQPTTSPSPSPTESATTLQDGYIPAPYTASNEDELTAEFLDPVFYENEDGPTIGVTLLGVIVQDGKYFRDLDNDQELDDFEDWRLDAETRAQAMAAAMTDHQLSYQLLNVMAYSPKSTKTADVVDENGEPVWTLIYPAQGGFGGGDEDPDATNIEYLQTSGMRNFVLRSNPETEVAVWFNNGLEQFSEYEAVTSGEVAVPYLTFTNPISHGLPNSEGVAAASLGDGNADAVLEDAQYDRQVMWAKGVEALYGPQIDLVTAPRWSRNSTTYGERVDMAEEIASNLVIGYQNGDQGMVEGSVLLTVKHFPGDGAAYNGFESHGYTGRYRVYSTENSLANYQLKPFIAAFEAGAAGVMPGYSQPADDPRTAPQSITYNGETYDIRLGGYGNAFNEDVLQYLLREVLGFDGLINSDSVSQSNAHGVEDMSGYDQTVLFVKAGCDAGVFSAAGQMGGMAISPELIEEALTNGDLTREELELAAYHRLLPQMQSGNLDNPYRDLEESVATVNEVTPKVESLAEEMNLKSVVLMKNSDATLPLSDTSVSVYVHGFNQDDDADVSGMVAALEGAGFTVVDDYTQADVAYLRVDPSIVGQGSSELAILDLAEDVETPIYDDNAKRTDDTALVTTVASMDEFQEIADAVHANGGKVVGEIDASNAWILTNMEPYCDALLGTFSTSDDAVVQVVTGAYNPTGKLPVTMVADASVIALVETELEGEMWDICVSPNDVPGYEKEQYMDADVLAASPSGSYAYQDSDGNFYWSDFGLSY
ncbi:glycoside hydrolase family 3 N-terminal domain-containing protein [Pseudoflavonifractor sp. CLA-AP-H29]|uniref:beta-glucosidase n=1 Tax=Pseudoflavonifractor intestinihominis TaxID=3133171 RepID=A0ABV1E722_9FIRM